jgi:ribulose-5-phosphate 4-epimerase/fuculose-1-phosphate aldolase
MHVHSAADLARDLYGRAWMAGTAGNLSLLPGRPRPAGGLPP